ncbi:hypothetical protein M405DRAFT_890492 [Rhizopogon salebrosus TDB-379]|nr:hypothetical protein M405DRAFT_890492 [Rhizopogon salebrosus TDB-379]
MPTESPPIFHGNGRASENPADFLKSFNRAMRQQSILTSAEKLDAFGDYLGTSSQAETWFKGLTSMQKASWSTFVSEFGLRWPTIAIAEKTKAEYEKELLDNVLHSTDVGTKATLYDRECWAHVVWAAKTLQLATNAGIAQSTSMIWQVRSTLPDTVKDLLKDEEYTDWAAFTKAVSELNGARLVEKQEQYRQRTQELHALRADLTRIQHRTQPQILDSLQNQFARMSIRPTPPVAPTASTYTRMPTQQIQRAPQSFSRQPAPQEPLLITAEMRTAVEMLIANLKHHPNTVVGNAAYATQVTQWNTKWGVAARVTAETGYPLKPGTAAIGSGECFACGTHGHSS